MRTSWIAVALALTVFAAQGQQAQPVAQAGAAGQDRTEAARNEADASYMRRVAQELGRSGDARYLAFAAIVGGSGSSVPPGQAQAWVQAALDAGAQDVQAYRLIVATKARETAALRAEAVRRWSRLEPGNLAPLMYAELSAPQLLERARSATHSDMGMYADVRWMQSALLRHRPTAQEWAALSNGLPFSVEENAAVVAMGLSAAWVFPNYLTLTRTCKAELLSADAQRLADCRHVAGLLTARSTTMLDQGVGLALWRQLAQTEDERAWALEQRRHFDWRMHQSSLHMPDTAVWMRLLFDPSVENEPQMLDRILQQAGIPAAPPAGWQRPVPGS